jgi:hypothetical protein
MYILHVEKRGKSVSLVEIVREEIGNQQEVSHYHHECNDKCHHRSNRHDEKQNKGFLICSVFGKVVGSDN